MSAPPATKRKKTGNGFKVSFGSKRVLPQLLIFLLLTSLGASIENGSGLPESSSLPGSHDGEISVGSSGSTSGNGSVDHDGLVGEKSKLLVDDLSGRRRNGGGNDDGGSRSEDWRKEDASTNEGQLLGSSLRLSVFSIGSG